MIRTERFDGGIRRYSDENVMIRQVETGSLYEVAVDIPDSTYTYEETEIPVKSQRNEAAEILDIILGGDSE